MGLSHSPSIVSENLEFYIDPSNTRSYPGFGNTVYNLVNSSMGCTFVNFTANPIDNANNRSIFFDNASNNALFIPSTNLQFGSSDFTIQFWFKFPGYSNNNGKTIFSDSWGPSNGGFLFYTYQSGGIEKILFYSTSTDGTWNIALEKDLIVSPSFNTWYNVAVTRTGSVFTLYANGQVTNTFSSTLSLRNTGLPYSLGASPTAANASKCSIGSVFIYRNKGLSALEINQNYHATKKQYFPEENIVTDGLILNLDPGNSRSYPGTGNTIYDLAGTGNSGNLINGPSFSNLNNGHFVFDGVNDTIRINNTMFGTLYSKATSYSCDLWMYINSTQNYTSNADNDIVENSGNYPFVIRYERPLLKTAIYDGVNNPQSSFTFTRDTWVHFTLVVNYANNTAFNYLNGVLVSTFSVASITNTLSVTNLFLFSRDGSLNWTTGKLGPFHMYRKALSATEVQQNYNSTKNRFVNVLPIVRNDLILNLDAANTASYPGFGTSWFDLSGSNNTSVLTNGPTYTYSDSLSNFLFDGSNDYVAVNSNANLLSKTEYTKFIFFYATSFATLNNLISGGVSGENHAFWLFGSNKLYAGHNTIWNQVIGSTTLSLNTWYCGAVTFSNVSGWKLYLNGILDGSNSNTTTFNNDGELRIGAFGNPNNFSGRIPLVLVYNRALSAYEIKQNFDFYRTRYGI